MTRLDLYLTLILLLSHLSLFSAQLIGTLTQCDHDLLRATITNTHTHHVSVLKHNTILTPHISPLHSQSLTQTASPCQWAQATSFTLAWAGMISWTWPLAGISRGI